MLQIISGKFFCNEDRFIHDGNGILFSNYSCIKPIETCVATLIPVDTSASVSSYIVSYTNQIEKEKPPGKNVLIRTGDSDIVEQFMIISSFALKAFFHRDRNAVDVACRDQRISSSDYHIPSQFVPRIFSRQILGTIVDAEELSNFTNNIIGLKRDDYKTVIASLRSYSNAMQIIGNNIDLTYSLLIYSLEALAQRSDSYSPKWEDYPDKVKGKLDKILKEVEIDISNDIKNTLLIDSNLKTTKRFIEFIDSNIDDLFFIDEAPSGIKTIRKSEFIQALNNAYTIRSNYVHSLQPIQELIKHPQISNGDVIQFSGEPYLTISGLIRVAHHVINNFVKKREKVAYEKIMWRNELPRIIHLETAPQCWISRYKDFEFKQATKKLSGFLKQLETAILNFESITDIRELLNKYEKLLGQSPEPYKRQMLTTYFLYNSYSSKEYKCLHYSEVFDNNKALFDQCSIETMLTWLLMGQSWTWKADLCSSYWNKYQRSRYKKSKLIVPPVMSVALIVEIAALFKKENNIPGYNEWMKKAVLESAGRKEIQKKLMEAKSSMIKITGMEIIKGASTKKV